MDGRIICVKDIYSNNNGKFITGQILSNSARLETYPCDSKLMKICRGNDWSQIEIFPMELIIAKAIRLPYKNQFYFSPLLHTLS